MTHLVIPMQKCRFQRLKNNKETLISIDSSIAECENMIMKYSIFLVSKNIINKFMA